MTDAFKAQPDDGKVLGFDFARDPLNAKKPMQTFQEILKADIDARPKVMSTQRRLLNQRYNLTPRLDPVAKMSRGKPLPVGPTARLAGGASWETLADMRPQEIRDRACSLIPPFPTPSRRPGARFFPRCR